MLPNESLLQVLHFTDYMTLVLAKLTGERFLRLIVKFAEELARRRSFRVCFYTTGITYIEATTDARQKSIPYKPSLVAACREVARLIGPHAVAKLMFSAAAYTWDVPDVNAIFEAAPPLKFAEEVEISTYNGVRICSEGFMHNFSGTKVLDLWLNYDAFCQFNWAFLRRESARELRCIKFIRISAWTESMDRSVEKLVRECAALPRLLGGEPLELDLSGNDYSGEFGKRIIELLKDSGRELTFRMKTRRVGELALDESDYTVDVDDTTTRYASEESGIVVEVKGHDVAIRSTTEVPRKKPRTSGEVLPVVPLLQ